MSRSHPSSVLVPCDHANKGGEARHCPACTGSGWVAVVTQVDGEPVRCEHANTGGSGNHCPACQGSGWAGLVSLT